MKSSNLIPGVSNLKAIKFVALLAGVCYSSFGCLESLFNLQSWMNYVQRSVGF